MYLCSKHGALSDKAVIHIDVMVEEKGDIVMEKNLYCLKCLTDLFNGFIDNGLIGRVTEQRLTK